LPILKWQDIEIKLIGGTQFSDNKYMCNWEDGLAPLFVSYSQDGFVFANHDEMMFKFTKINYNWLQYRFSSGSHKPQK